MQENVIEALSRRISNLERALIAGKTSAVEGRFKRAAGTITAGDVYVIQTTANRLINTTTTEADANPIVVAVNSTSAVNEWARCTDTGYAWVNFEDGTDPTIRDYVVTSTTAGKAKAQSESSSASIGRLIQWGVGTLRGYVSLTKQGGGDAFYQIATPTPVAGKLNLWYKSGSGGDSQYAAHHSFEYSFGESEWIDKFGWL